MNSPRLRKKSSKGFALVIAVTLMVLLTIIAVGFLSLSTVTLRASTAMEATSVARANARMALVQAIAQLQLYTGPDTRVTATADMAGDDTGQRTAAGAEPKNDMSVNNISKGLVAVQPGTRYWTGVWKNKPTTATADPAKEIYTKTPSPEFVQWLVSGNDISGSSGNLAPNLSDYAVNASGEVSKPELAVVLVGEGSVGKASAQTVENYVVAPLIEMKDATGKTAKGRYAWWVGDEGTKAKMDMNRTESDGSLYTSLPAQRRGWEIVDGLSSYPLPPQDTAIEKIITVAEAGLLMPQAIQATGASGASPLQAIFHSATSDSKAVLADPLSGGTKIDLTAMLSSASLPSTKPQNVSSLLAYPVKGKPIIPMISGVSSAIKAPLWDALKEFHDRHDSLSGDTLIVMASTKIQNASIAPLITDFRILMGAKIKAAPGGSTTTNPTCKVHPCGKIAIGIANPYSKVLKWEKDLEIQLINATPSGNQPSRIWPLDGASAPAYFPKDTSEPAVFNNAVFRIPASSLPPGEARAYTMSGPVYRSYASGTSRVVINLVPFLSSSPSSFINCVELENAKDRNSPITMDVRESWQTTQINVEMRLAGASSSSQPLRRIERFELDNGYFVPNQRTFSADDCKKILHPVPLMLYSYQISQPGGDYKNYMPGGYEMGQRGSTLRTFADFNLAATRISKPIASYSPPPFFLESNDSFSQLPSAPPGGQTGAGFTRNLASDPLRWGRAPNGSKKTILFTVPAEITSLALFQHADLTGDDVAASIGHQPGNAFGNSYATPFVKRLNTWQNRTDYQLIGSPNPSGATTTTRKYYDISYFLNTTLWDGYYLSTIDSGKKPIEPRIPSVTLFRPGDTSAEILDPVMAAGHLMINGAFNVNSTDKNAWKALLASAKHFKHKADAASGNIEAAFPRSLEQTDSSVVPPTGTAEDSFSGFRRLNDAQIDALAEEITKQVRLRGPFLSLSHFVNRAVTAITKQPALTRCGALQAAIDESGANISFDQSKNIFNGINAKADAVTLQEYGGAPRADMDGTLTVNRPSSTSSSDPDWASRSRDQNYGAVAGILADREMLKTTKYKPEQGYRSTGIPGWLTQADVLQVLGPCLTARSDTFRVRAYGEALDASGNRLAKAYCEAIVQRTPNYMDASNLPHERDAATSSTKVLTPTNQTYGRKYEIVSFRWLSATEI